MGEGGILQKIIKNVKQNKISNQIKMLKLLYFHSNISFAQGLGKKGKMIF